MLSGNIYCERNRRVKNFLFCVKEKITSSLKNEVSKWFILFIILIFVHYAYNFILVHSKTSPIKQHASIRSKPNAQGLERGFGSRSVGNTLKSRKPDSCALISHPWAQPNRWQHSVLQGDLAIRGARNWREKDIFLTEIRKLRRIDARWIRIYFLSLTHSLALSL